MICNDRNFINRPLLYRGAARGSSGARSHASSARGTRRGRGAKPGQSAARVSVSPAPARSTDHHAFKRRDRIHRITGTAKEPDLPFNLPRVSALESWLANADGGALPHDHGFRLGCKGCPGPSFIDLAGLFPAVFVGAIADNFSRRMIVIAGRSPMMAASAILTILMALNSWMILAFSFLDGRGIALSDPAWRGSIGDILERRHLRRRYAPSMSVQHGPQCRSRLWRLVVAAFGPLVTFALTTLWVCRPLTALWRNKGRFKPHLSPAKRS